jgi:phosphatidylglycerophosphatase A
LSAKSEITKELITEAGDSINAQIAEVSPKRTVKDFVALAIATCGVGYIPLAPGTWGSAVGVAVFMALRRLALETIYRIGTTSPLLLFYRQTYFVALQLVGVTVITLVGIWAASRTEKLLQKKDPGKVVIDEVAGQLIALLPVPLMTVGPWRLWLIVGFFLFRAFDIIKPYPVRRLEALPSGLGIVADDLAAGAYAAVILSIVIALFLILA